MSMFCQNILLNLKIEIEKKNQTHGYALVIDPLGRF